MAASGEILNSGYICGNLTYFSKIGISNSLKLYHENMVILLFQQKFEKSLFFLNILNILNLISFSLGNLVYGIKMF